MFDDALGQLLTETHNGTVVNRMEYDNYGNILTKNGNWYTYGDEIWKDKLTKVGLDTITHDAQGNPTSYLGHTLTWEKGRQLKSFDGNTYTQRQRYPYLQDYQRCEAYLHSGRHQDPS